MTADGTPKRFRRGTHRSLAPAATLERVRPLMARFGVTRLASVTGLDRVGIPVVIACRPNARSHAVWQGKGLDPTAAKVSALMEALETACAERIGRRRTETAAAAALRAGGRTLVDWTGLPRPAGGARFDERTPIPWIEGQDLLAGGVATWVPLESVHADFTVPAPPGSGVFLTSTNGLASGNDAAEALVHALCEVIERDAATLFDLRPAALEERRLALASIDDPDCLDLLDRFRAAALAVAVWDLTSEVGVPAFRCHVMERTDEPHLLPLPAEGQGCHPDPAIALGRALTEAAQARVTAIAGVRDDIGHRFYEPVEDAATLARWRSLVLSAAWGRRFGEAAGWAAATHEEDVATLLTRLRAAGIAQAVAVDLTPGPAFPVAVVRAVVPGLEGLHHDRYLASPRARARAGPTGRSVRWLTS